MPSLRKLFELQDQPPRIPRQTPAICLYVHQEFTLSVEIYEPAPEGRLTVGPILAVILRAAFGLMVAMFLAFLGFFAGWLSAPPGPVVPPPMLIGGAGLGAAVGGAIGWFKPETPRHVNWINLGLVLIGGLAGAWAGWELGPVIYPEGLYRPGGSIYNAPPFYVSIMGASIGANIPALFFYTFRLWRYREV